LDDAVADGPITSWVGMLPKDQKLRGLTAREYIASLQEIKQFIGRCSKATQIQRHSLLMNKSLIGKPEAFRSGRRQSRFQYPASRPSRRRETS